MIRCFTHLLEELPPGLLSSSFSVRHLRILKSKKKVRADFSPIPFWRHERRKYGNCIVVGASLLPVQYARSSYWTLERRAAKPLNLAQLERRCTRFSWKSSLCSIGKMLSLYSMRKEGNWWRSDHYDSLFHPLRPIREVGGCAGPRSL